MPPSHFLTPLANNSKLITGLSILAIISACAYWFSLYNAASFNFNVIWLSECAKRILAGGHMVDVCFETNPPLSIILYMPLVVMQQALPQFSMNILFAYYTLCCVIIASGAVYYFAQKITFISAQNALIFSLLFLLANTALTGRFFGERDHFAFMGTFVFFLAQYSMTMKMTSNKVLLYLSLLIGGIGILIKPHYGLVPFLMMIDRLRQWKSPRAIFQPDIIILGGLCLVYIAIVRHYFPDYIFDILPQSAALYAKAQFHEGYGMPFLKGAAVLGLCWFAMYKNAPQDARAFLNRLFIMAAVGIFVFLIQKKGWGYHLVPFYGSLFCAVFISLYLIVPKLQNKHAHQITAQLTIIIMAIISAFMINKIPAQAPDHNDFRNYNLAREIRTIPEGESCKFMMFAGMREVQSLAYYNRCELASRFAVIWFFAPIAQYLDTQNPDIKAKSAQTVQYYADMIAADLTTHRPQTIIARKPKAVFFKALQETSETFRSAWSDYILIKEVPNETPDYFAGSPYRDISAKQGYQIYKRRDLVPP